MYICTSCKQLYYRHCVSLFKQDTVKDQSLKKLIPTVHSVSDLVWICGTCKSYITKNRIPPMSVMNKMSFPEQGPLEDLNPLEQTLLAVRIPFMKIHETARGRQKFIHGNMVLVPADVHNTVTQLPRLITNDCTIKATLKRRLQYKHHVCSVNIRPELVRNCAQLLSKKSLFREHIVFNYDWKVDTPSNSGSLETLQGPSVPSDSDLRETEPIIFPQPSTSSVSDEVQSKIEKDIAAKSYLSRISDPLQTKNQESDSAVCVKNNTDQDDDKWSELDEDEAMAMAACQTHFYPLKTLLKIMKETKFMILRQVRGVFQLVYFLKMTLRSWHFQEYFVVKSDLLMLSAL